MALFVHYRASYERQLLEGNFDDDVNAFFDANAFWGVLKN